MIPKRYIQEWSDYAPWQNPDHIEQDLIISRTLVALFSDDYLSENLAFRGGTALHKLYLDPAPRYSEDIDLVQIKPGPIKPILQQIDQVINYFEGKRVVKPKANNNTLLYRFNSEFNPETRLKLKIEINCREHFNVFPFVSPPFTMENGWFSGYAKITSYEIHELLASKLRALYQRRKGRDLFDLYYASTIVELDYERLLQAYQKYITFEGRVQPSQKQFLSNMEEKEANADFQGDMEGIKRLDVEYNQSKAFNWLKNKIISKML